MRNVRMNLGARKSREYWCFISYRHTDNTEPGREWASWLHHSLETYEVPKDLVGKTNNRGEIIPAQIYPVFRDEEELAAGHLKEGIRAALQVAKSLVVICSPGTPSSAYIDEEIRTYKQLRDQEIREGKTPRRADPIIMVIEGNPEADEPGSGACIPKSLQYEVDEACQLTDQPAAESLWMDFRLSTGEQGWTSAGAYREASLLAGSFSSKKAVEAEAGAYAKTLEAHRLQIIAGILGVPLGELQKRDEAYQLQKARKRARALRLWLAAVGIFAVAAVVGGIIAVDQRNRAQIEAGEGWLLRSEVARENGNDIESAFYAARAVGFEGFGKASSSPFRFEAIPDVWNRLTQRKLRQTTPPDGEKDFPRLLSPRLALTKSNQASSRAELAKAFPFLWSSPVASLHSDLVGSVAFCPDGQTLARGK